MNLATKFVLGLILLMVLTPLVIGWVNQLLVPFLILVAGVLIARVVWFYTHL
jgi:hypothetical protein